LRMVVVFAALAIAFATSGHATMKPINSFPNEPRPGVVPFTAVITNGTVTFSWPVLPGNWGLVEKQTTNGEWKPVPSEQYHTNGIMVSATLPIPRQATLYRVKRTLGFRTPSLPNFPPMPPPPTNRMPPKLPTHS
jgi:hypothetical protein